MENGLLVLLHSVMLGNLTAAQIFHSFASLNPNAADQALFGLTPDGHVLTIGFEDSAAGDGRQRLPGRRGRYSRHAGRATVSCRPCRIVAGLLKSRGQPAKKIGELEQNDLEEAQSLRVDLLRPSGVGFVASASHAITVGLIIPRTRNWRRPSYAFVCGIGVAPFVF